MTRRRAPAAGLAKWWLLSMVVMAMLAATSGLAYAGSLPAVAQEAARSTMARVGIKVPGPNDDAETPPHSRDPDPRLTLPEVARTTTGREPGRGSAPSVSNANSGKQQRPRNRDRDQDAPSGASARPPNAADSGTANKAGDADTESTTTADEASNGRAAAGSGNAGDHPQNPAEPGHEADDHRPTRP